MTLSQSWHDAASEIVKFTDRMMMPTGDGWWLTVRAEQVCMGASVAQFPWQSKAFTSGLDAGVFFDSLQLPLTKKRIMTAGDGTVVVLWNQYT